jgi:hypothetical protein
MQRSEGSEAEGNFTSDEGVHPRVYTVTGPCASESSKLHWSNTICCVYTDV